MAFKMKKFSGFGKGSGKETPMNFNAGLKAASKAGKLDNNPKFKAAVDSAPVKMKKESPKKFLKGVGKFLRKNPVASAVMGGPVALAAMGDKGRASLADKIGDGASGLAMKKKNK